VHVERSWCEAISAQPQSTWNSVLLWRGHHEKCEWVIRTRDLLSTQLVAQLRRPVSYQRHLPLLEASGKIDTSSSSGMHLTSSVIIYPLCRSSDSNTRDEIQRRGTHGACSPHLELLAGGSGCSLHAGKPPITREPGAKTWERFNFSITLFLWNNWCRSDRSLYELPDPQRNVTLCKIYLIWRFCAYNFLHVI
jgi:hypothetical protein